MKRPSPLIIELFTEKLNFQKENNKEGKGTEKKKIKSDHNIETVSFGSITEGNHGRSHIGKHLI